MQQRIPQGDEHRGHHPLAGGGEMGERMRAIDWSATPLGPVESWPQSLKTCVRIILTSAQPMFVWWGESLINLYNDAYKSIVGGKHPEALGQPAAVVWREIWDQVGPRAEQSMHRNEGTYDEALLLIMERYGYPEETYYTFSYSPVPNDHGGTGGIICANTDDTERIINARRLALLRELASRAGDARTVDGVTSEATRCLATASRDLPFALLYLVEGDTLTLAGTAGIEAGHDAAPRVIRRGERSAWPVDDVVRHGALRMVDDLATRFGELPTGEWHSPPKQACVLPLMSGHEGPRGALVVGINPFRPFNDRFQSFVTLVAGQIAAALASADAYETERKRAEALAEIDRAKTAFFSNVSHEFRTPLTLMLGPSEDLLNGGRGELLPEQRKEVELLHRNALRLQRLVNSLLDFSRFEAGRADASYEATNLAEYTGELASVFRSAIEKAGLRFELALDPIADPLWVDRAMYEKIVFNLLSNALKFTFEGSISVTLRDESEHVELSVRDTGVGIPASELPRLFERFHRVQGARARSHEGSGIGLALVQELARLHGGSVRAESIEGSGTKFVVAIRKGRAHLPSDRIQAERSVGSTNLRARVYLNEALRWVSHDADAVDEAPEEAPNTRVDIVVADDNADMRDYITRLLSPLYDVRAVDNGRAALRTIEARRPQLLVTDMMMPELDGFGLVAALRANPETRSLPIVMLSARAGEEAKVEGLQAGVDDYLVKPFSARELLAKIKSQLELSRIRAEVDSERARLRDLLMNAPAGIALLRLPDYTFELANDPYLRLVAGRDVLGKRLLDAMPEVADQGIVELLDRVVATRTPYVGREHRVELDRGDGRRDELFLNFVYTPFSDASGTVVGVAAFGFEVTDLVVARKHAEDATRLRDDFLSVASHELRTPMTSLLLQTQLASRLAQSGAPHAKLDEKIRTIHKQGRRMETLISGLLDVSRISAGKLELNAERLDLAAAVRDVVERLDEQLAASGSTLACELLPVVGEWDPLRIDQVVTNLLSNAIKYGRGAPISVWTRAHDGHAQLVVRDLGIGIDKANLGRLFGRFERFVDSRNYGGLGLGLWIVRHIVTAMAGTIDVVTEPGTGTTFTVTLPLRVETSAVSPPSSRA